MTNEFFLWLKLVQKLGKLVNDNKSNKQNDQVLITEIYGQVIRKKQFYEFYLNIGIK